MTIKIRPKRGAMTLVDWPRGPAAGGGRLQVVGVLDGRGPRWVVREGGRDLAEFTGPGSLERARRFEARLAATSPGRAA